MYKMGNICYSDSRSTLSWVGLLDVYLVSHALTENHQIQYNRLTFDPDPTSAQCQWLQGKTVLV